MQRASQRSSQTILSTRTYKLVYYQRNFAKIR